MFYIFYIAWKDTSVEKKYWKTMETMLYIDRNRTGTVQFSRAMPVYFRRKWPLVLFHANLPIFVFIKKRKNDINKGLLFTIISIILLRTTCSETDHSLFISTHFKDIPNYLLVGFLINSAREDTPLQD